MIGSQHALLDHLTHAAQSLQAAVELAAERGDHIAAQIMQRASVFVASSISAVVSPLEHSVAGVLQGPVPVKPKTIGRAA